MMIDTRRWENMHIPLWLIKDTCWMLEWKWLGVIMITPTILMAIYILKQTWNHAEFWINLAIVFWISANSFWMCSEFFGFVQYKNFAGIPFGMGFIAVALFYIKSAKEKAQAN